MSVTVLSVIVFAIGHSRGAAPELPPDLPPPKVMPDSIVIDTIADGDADVIIESHKIKCTVGVLDSPAAGPGSVYFTFREMTKSRFSFSYRWDDRQDAIIPFYGAIYKVVAADFRGLRAGKLQLERVHDDELAKELAIKPGNVTVPPKSELGFEQRNPPSWQARIKVSEIKGPPSDRPSTVIQTSYIHPDSTQKYVSIATDKAENPGVGDSFTIADRTFTVVKIVSPDIKRAIIGWVELSVKDSPAKPGSEKAPRSDGENSKND